jgi:hypothetical protein
MDNKFHTAVHRVMGTGENSVEDLLEFRYPNGARHIHDRRQDTMRYIRPDGTEALTGETIELQLGRICEVPDFSSLENQEYRDSLDDM